MQQSATANSNTKKIRRGLAINFCDGVRGQWLIVEYDDGTASVHGDWDEAMKAGDFDIAAELAANEKELDQLFAELQPGIDALDQELTM